MCQPKTPNCDLLILISVQNRAWSDPHIERTSTPSTAQYIDATTFEELVQKPENLERNLELVAGEIVEMVSNQRSSVLALRIGHLLTTYVFQDNLGFLTGMDGGFAFGNDRYIPDIAYVPFERQSAPGTEAYAQTLPALVVEVLSPANHKQPSVMRKKLHTYVRFDVVVWLVDLQAETIEVFAPGEQVRTSGKGDTLDGKPVLPEFSVAVKDIFAVSGPQS
jgi:Uma2 family endonuclease